MESIKRAKGLWIDIHGIMVLFTWVLELFLSYFSLKYFQIGLLLKQRFGYLIGLNWKKFLVECTLLNVTQYSCKVK
jgi:hypothetical protein